MKRFWVESLLLITFLRVASSSKELGLSWFVHLSDLHISEFQDLARGPDLVSLAENFLLHLEPEVLVLTGDLTDSKTSFGRAKQFEQEWVAYREVMDKVRNSTGLVWEDILDIRGNHDTFDVPHRNHPRDYFSQFAASGNYWVNSRIRLTPLLSRSGPRAQLCPAAWLIGVDVSPDPGLRGPTNFVGFARDSLIDELDKTLYDLRAGWENDACKPVLIAYGHYPLELVAHEFQDHWGVGGNVRDRDRLGTVLTKHGVDAYLCGHLHDKFGRQLHRVLVGDKTSLAELETADWKISRRFRIVAVSGWDVSFVDLIYCPSKDSSRKSILPEDKDMIIGKYVLLIVSPASAFYSPLGFRSSSGLPTRFRALVVPVYEFGKAEVYLKWFCEETKRNGTEKMHPHDAEKTVFEVEQPASVQCQGDSITLRVSVEEDGVIDSISGFHKVHLKEARSPIEYPHTFMEQITLNTKWVQSARHLFFLFWSAHCFGLLLLPRLLSMNGYFLAPDVKGSTKPVKSKGMNDESLSLSFYSPARILLCSVQEPIAYSVKRLCWASQATLFWVGELVFCIHLVLGPWAVLKPLSDHPPCFLFRYRIWCPSLEIKQNEVMSSSQMLLMCSFHYFFTILPGTLWKIWIVSSWQEGPRAMKWPRVFSLICQSGIALGLLFIHFFFLLRLWTWYGLTAVFLSPAIGWFGPISLLCLMFAKKDARKLRTD